MASRSRIRQFLFPSLTTKFLIRIVLVAFFAYLFFGHICTPILIRGSSMEPTYHHGSVNFCLKLRYLFSAPRRYDVVALRFAGDKVMLLKRVVALEGEHVEFREGRLFINGEELAEPYVRYPCRWDLPPRQVEKNAIYVVGDNRDMPIEQHTFGQTSMKRVVGAPLW